MTTHITVNCLLDMIRQLRQREEVILYGVLLNLTSEDLAGTTTFLEQEYECEALHFPHAVPPFDASAALWSTRIVYTSAQLLLARESMPTELPTLLPDYEGAQTPSAILSADLCLRFLPAMIKHLRAADSEDPLIPLLEKHLITWHYSGVDHPLDIAALDFSAYTDPCLHALYRDRIIHHQHIALATHPVFEASIRAAVGLHGNVLWKKFNDTIHPTNL
jgi:hypothetical protein